MPGTSDEYRITPELIECVQDAGREILAMGHNPVFTKGNSRTDLDICAEMIEEARKIVAMGYNAKFSCYALKGGVGDDERRERRER